MPPLPEEVIPEARLRRLWKGATFHTLALMLSKLQQSHLAAEGVELALEVSAASVSASVVLTSSSSSTIISCKTGKVKKSKGIIGFVVLLPVSMLSLRVECIASNWCRRGYLHR